MNIDMKDHWRCMAYQNMINIRFHYCKLCHPEVGVLEKIADSLHKIMRILEEKE